MLEKLFLVYANLSLRENIENLHEIFEEIYPHIAHDIDGIFLDHTRKFVDILVSFSEFEDPEEANDYRNTLISRALPGLQEMVDVAYEAAFMYRNGYCEKYQMKDCGILMRRLHSEIGIGSNQRLKCYECYQYRYIKNLNNLAGIILRKQFHAERKKADSFTLNEEEVHLLNDWAGMRHFKIGDVFDDHSDSFYWLNFRDAYEFVKPEIWMASEADQIITKAYKLHIAGLVGRNRDITRRFNTFMQSIVHFSLAEFLFNGDWRKLRRCEECGDFYISKTRGYSKYCSSKCRMKYHNRRRIESGEARKYKRRKRKEGAKESYYG